MTLQQTILICRENAATCDTNREYHLQLADWLEELVKFRDKNRWISVTEKPPKEGTYLTTMDGEIANSKEPFTSMCGYENGSWDESDSVLAWMPLPEPYGGDRHE